MDYIEYMRNLRNARYIISEKIPEIERIIEKRKNIYFDPDLHVLNMSDMEFNIMVRTYEEIEVKIFDFNTEDEYGSVKTMDKSEMRGYQ